MCDVTVNGERCDEFYWLSYIISTQIYTVPISAIGSVILFIGTTLFCCYYVKHVNVPSSGESENTSGIAGSRIVSTKRYGAILTDDLRKTFVHVPSLIEMLDRKLAGELNKCIIDAPVSLENVIVSGNFGEIAHGHLVTEDYSKVLIKYLKGLTASVITDNEGMPIIENFLRDIFSLKLLRHPNIHTIVGIVMEESISALAIYPFMAYGHLKSFLCHQQDNLTEDDRLYFTEQIVNGLIYLSEMKYVHHDLACRNCLIDEDYTVKIGDSALSMDLYITDYDPMPGWPTRAVPARWMAIETIQERLFTLKSNIWSMGVIMYEIYAIEAGKKLYHEVPTKRLIGHLQAGRRLLKAGVLTTGRIWEMMASCWNEEPGTRPSLDVINALVKASRTGRRYTTGESSEYYRASDKTITATEEWMMNGTLNNSGAFDDEENMKSL